MEIAPSKCKSFIQSVFAHYFCHDGEITEILIFLVLQISWIQNQLRCEYDGADIGSAVSLKVYASRVAKQPLIEYVSDVSVMYMIACTVTVPSGYEHYKYSM